MKAHIDQHIISIQGIHRHHLQLTEVKCIQFLPHQIGITPLYVIRCYICLGHKYRYHCSNLLSTRYGIPKIFQAHLNPTYFKALLLQMRVIKYSIMILWLSISLFQNVFGNFSKIFPFAFLFLSFILHSSSHVSTLYKNTKHHM